MKLVAPLTKGLFSFPRPSQHAQRSRALNLGRCSNELVSSTLKGMRKKYLSIFLYILSGISLVIFLLGVPLILWCSIGIHKIGSGSCEMNTALIKIWLCLAISVILFVVARASHHK